MDDSYMTGINTSNINMRNTMMNNTGRGSGNMMISNMNMRGMIMSNKTMSNIAMKNIGRRLTMKSMAHLRRNILNYGKKIHLLEDLEFADVTRTPRPGQSRQVSHSVPEAHFSTPGNKRYSPKIVRDEELI